MNQQITPAEKAKNFQMLTSQYWNPVETKTGAVSSTYLFDIPRARLLDKLSLRVTATLNSIHASGTAYVPHEDSPWNFISKIRLLTNGAFTLVNISGAGLYLYNLMCSSLKTALDVATSGRGIAVQGTASAATTGTDNAVRVTFDIPVTVNPRDPQSLIKLQSDTDLVQLEVTTNSIANSLAPTAGGYTFAVSNISLALAAQTYAIPLNNEPDYGMIKIVKEKTETLIAGENTIKLEVNQIYRKIGFIVYNATPARVADSTITSPIELILNGANIRYKWNVLDLVDINTRQYGAPLPTGMYAIDLGSIPGLPNLASPRDLIDTANLTEFWLRFTSGAGTCKVVTETLNVLK